MHRRLAHRARRAAFGAVIGAGVASGAVALILVVAYAFDAYMDKVSLRRVDRDTSVVVAVPQDRFGTPIVEDIEP